MSRIVVRQSVRVAASMLLMVPLACSEPAATPRPDPSEYQASSDSLHAEIVGLRLRITNVSDQTFYMIIMERQLWELFVPPWPCGAPLCKGVAAGDTLSIAVEDIEGYSKLAREARIIYWHLIEIGEPRYPGGPRHYPDSLRSLIVPLP